MAYAESEKWKNTLSGAVELGATGAGIGTAIAPGPGTAIGGGIGAILGAAKGYFLTDDEKNEMIEAFRNGEIDDDTLANIERTIARRYNILRRQQGADMARRGTSNSSWAQRQTADTYNAERGSLARAITGESERRQMIGFGMSDAAGAERAQGVAQGIGALSQGYQLYQEGQAMEADTKRADTLAAAIGALFENNGTDMPAVAGSKTGAGNSFARHRTRQPNVTSPFLTKGNPLEKKLLPSWMQ